MYKSIRPGKIWYDTDGKRIQAHGGSIIFVNNIFYWYGENKEGITGRATGEKCKFWHHGVKLYSSIDLYNWKDEGYVIKESDDPSNPFYPANIMDRPHILYNEKTNKFVMWAKTSKSDFDSCAFSVCIGDSLKNMNFIKEVKPKGFHAGDFDLFIDNNNAYIVFENPHTEMVVIKLTDDYLDVTDEVSSHIFKECPPFVREAPAYFNYKGIKYLLTSGTTGYYPNKSIVYKMNSIHGKWEEINNPCENDVFNNSFHAQFSSVFKHPTIKDLYIALGDRWLTDLVLDLPNMDEAFYEMFSKNIKEKKNLYNENLTDENTSEANYVWLPIRFDENNIPHIHYLREWKIED